ncbi:Hsp90 co-chaperone [Blastocystis sp. ATCC 50177/Nand II]|uniref:Hsp90 co-chaperone n=1 Tax=Blastocystis sp. subtype 1 (strain ATCC 50177 / NandII) TaxID=478820 RepID=A0A196SB08_BLAHN|nr:Hsp90 co-chaperone [Blastocystis sp. ATCC 50177/Nand II]
MKWAQRKESVFVTISVGGITDPKVDITPSTLSFAGKTKDNEYAVTLSFYKDIDPKTSKWSCTDRCVQFHLMKDSSESWPQLLKEKNQYKNLLQIDWDRWADSDDEDADGNPAGNFQLPPNFQELMKNYVKNDQPKDDGCGCDECHCGHDHCESDCSSCESESSDDEMPPLEKDN